MKAIETIIKPVVTEKATGLAEKRIYCFWVNKKATKIDIKRALKEIYGAEVVSVRSSYQRAKQKYFRKGISDKRPEMKKAFVTLKNKEKLDTTRFEKETSAKEPKVIKAGKTKKTSSSKSTTK